MQSIRLLLSPKAKEDLRDIYLHGIETWGLTQSTKYLSLIKSQVLNLIEFPLIGIDRGTLMKEVRSISVESHVIFYRLRNNDIELLRILHQRQDPERHLIRRV